MKVPHYVCVFGTRPEAIKMAPLVRRLRAMASVRLSVVTSGQHREMLSQVLEFFEITPDIQLDVMQQGQTLAELNARLLTELHEVFERLQPSIVLVHGDTTTTMAAALAAFYAQVPVGHVEAGLRTNNLRSPWPEECNRRLTAVLADLHFAPTECARKALISEGRSDENIWVTGNTVIDALFDASGMITARPELQRRIQDALPVVQENKRRVLVTGHRRENLDGGLASLCAALDELARRGDIEILFPIHLNPIVQDTVRRSLSDNSAIHLMPPLDYPTFVAAMQSAYLILTDSGGIQEEAPALGKPVLVLRDTTERPEAVEAGTVRVIGTETSRIIAETNMLLDSPADYTRMSIAHNPYGDGNASIRIIEALRGSFSL